ncbi:hypothetical protein LTR56_001658 [Elasticomyces elasticus]|nr:hypothetical protein LTR56_001658 [Elasticomyces elasticus]KAK3667290.1 hypothetical protein LTR22_001806 [Elasticomyces elasticus]KAK4932630.1 hypothetical protein LTR49_001054 [Elasticomyces elasticus]KAK5769652.1 hypothetical protein LTS12_000102 [Elasticomyces elasticus]
MAAWERLINAILTTRWNRPIPVLMVPAGVAYWIGLKQQAKQTQIIEKIEALTEKVDRLTSRVD